MSGELLNTSNFIKQRNITSGLGGFSSGSINELFDLDGDGKASPLELDRAENAGLINEMESIHPAVARAFSDDTFALQTGQFLTREQQIKRRKLQLLIEREVLKQKQKEEEEVKRPDLEPIDELNILNDQEIDYNDLQGDIQKRQYLTQAELDNDV